MDLEQSVQAMLQELRQASELGGQIQHKLNDSQQQFNAWREEVESQLASVTHEIAEVEQSLLNHREEIVHQIQALISGTVVPMAESVRNGQTQISQWQDRATTLVDNITQASGDFHAAVESANEDLQQRVQTLASTVSEVQSQIRSEFDEARQDVQDLTDFVSQSHEDWQTFVQDTGEQMQSAQQECQAQLDSEFFQPMESCLGQFNDLMTRVNQDALAHPMTLLKDQATQVIDQEITQVFNQGFEELNHLMDEMMKKISGSSDKSNAERQALHEIFKAVEQLLDPIKEKMESIQALAKPFDLL